MLLSKPEERVLIVAPIGQDAAAMAALLQKEGFQPSVCSGPAECSATIPAGAGVLLLTEEALELPQVPALIDTLRAQPAWSELPLIILTSGGESRQARLLDWVAEAARSLTMLERPMNGATLLRSVQVALRSRLRQYQVRDLIEQQKRDQEHLRESEERFRLLAENIPQLAWMTDAQGWIFWYNRRWFDYTGTTLEEMQGWGWQKVHHPEHVTRVTHKFKQALERGDRWEDTFPLRGRDGNYRWFLSRAFPIRDAHGNITRWFGTNTDITQLRETQEALRASEERAQQQFAQLEAIYRTAPLGLAVLDTELRYQRINERLAEINGFPIEAHLGKTVREIAPALAEQAESVLQRVVQSGRPVHGEFRGETKAQPGIERFWDEWGYPLRDAGGNIVAIGVVAEEITERRCIEAALAKAQAELKKHADNLERAVAERTAELRATNEQLETFVYSVAHDLRAPLRSITAYSQLLLDDHAAALGEGPQHLLNRIQASSEFLDKLLLDLLAFGRTARTEIELGPVEVQVSWDRAAFQCATQIEQSRAQIRVDGSLPTVRAHEATLTQSLANLLSNALKFVAPGVRPAVRFWAEERAHAIRLWVEDNGIGIPEREQERVFRVFERLNGARYPGTGIGLSIVRKGMERMGGRAGLESGPGQGSRFWIELSKVS